MKLVLALVCLVTLVPVSLEAQNVTNYGSIPDPFLFLLREPAIHRDLELTADQQAKLKELNETYDAQLLSTRNMKPEKGQPIIEKVLVESRRRVRQIFTRDQQERLRQITYRLRGISFVLDDQASKKLSLTRQQRKRIKSLTKKAGEELTRLQKQLADGSSSQEEMNEAAKQVQTAEQRDVLVVLTPQQQQTLKAIVGRQFDASTLSQVSFKAPELSDSGHWINSAAIKLAQLRGKVVAVHFWAFG